MLRFVSEVPEPRRPEDSEEDLEWIEPIAFFPDDLPDLRTDSFGWTPEEMQDAVRLADRWRNTEPLTMRLVA